MTKDSQEARKALREPAEIRNADELAALQQIDTGPKPENWKLSPKAVLKFILGTEEPIPFKKDGKSHISIRPKFYGDETLVQRTLATLASERSLLLIGEPGTAKSWLSEHLAAAISGNSLATIQGTAGTTEDNIKYSWNYALLLSQGPSLEALVPAPLFLGMKEGRIVRFEEITRCPHEIQDSMISVLSDKVLMVPELPPPDDVLLAKPGFSVIGTANTRDRGVNEMSSALKRRFNFETVKPIQDIQEETELVVERTQEFLENSQIPLEVTTDVIELLITTFSELRSGSTEDGIGLSRPTAVMSTAEAVDVSINSAMYSTFIKDQKTITPNALVLNLMGTIVKDNEDDLTKLRSYFDVIVRRRIEQSKLWKEYFEARKYLNL